MLSGWLRLGCALADRSVAAGVSHELVCLAVPLGSFIRLGALPALASLVLCVFGNSCQLS